MELAGGSAWEEMAALMCVSFNGEFARPAAAAATASVCKPFVCDEIKGVKLNVKT